MWLTDVFYVARDPVIRHFTDVIESAIVVPLRGAVGVEVLANHGSRDVGVAIHIVARIRRIEGGDDVSGRADVDRLHSGVSVRAEEIKLEICSVARLIGQIARM